MHDTTRFLMVREELPRFMPCRCALRPRGIQGPGPKPALAGTGLMGGSAPLPTQGAMEHSPSPPESVQASRQRTALAQPDGIPFHCPRPESRRCRVQWLGGMQTRDARNAKALKTQPKRLIWQCCSEQQQMNKFKVLEQCLNNNAHGLASRDGNGIRKHLKVGCKV